MLPATPGWTRRDGAEVKLESELGEVVFRDELAPIVRLSPDQGRGAERFVTREGEYGTLIRRGPQLTAIILGDRHYARLDGRAAEGREEELAAAVLELAKSVSFGLGVRRRRLLYAPPPGWLPVIRGLVTDWIAPVAPRGASQMRIYPANPTAADPEDVLTALVAESVTGTGLAVELDERRAVSGGFVVGARMIGDRELHRTWALFRSGSYLCTMRLESTRATDHANHQADLDAVIASCEPVPEPSGPPSAALAIWVD